MSEEEKKSLFDRAIDALTDRDEKAAAAKAAAEKASAEKAAVEKAAAERASAAKASAEKAAAEEAATEKATAEKAAAFKASAERSTAIRAAAQKEAAEKAAAAPKKGVVTVRSLRIRADHNTTSEVVGGLVEGDEVMILSTWSDGKDTWAKLDKGWAAMLYDGGIYIKTV